MFVKKSTFEKLEEQLHKKFQSIDESTLDLRQALYGGKKGFERIGPYQVPVERPEVIGLKQELAKLKAIIAELCDEVYKDDKGAQK